MPGLFRHPFQAPQRSRTYPTFEAEATNAAAELASGTGAAYNATVSLGPTTVLASGTGTAYQPSISLAPTAGHASGTGAANAATANVQPNAALASGTGQAFNITALIASNASAGHASGSGAANQPAASVAPAGRAVGDWRARGRATMGPGGSASYEIDFWGVGYPFNIVATLVFQTGAGAFSIDWNNDVGFGGNLYSSVVDDPQDQEWTIDFEVWGVPGDTFWRGRAYPTAGPVGAWAAGEALAISTPKVDDTFSWAFGNATETSFEKWGNPGGWGDAFNATVETAVVTNANAGHASGSGTAFNATTTIASAINVATGTGAAYGAAASVATSAGGAAGSGQAGGPSPTIQTGAGHAAGTGTAFDATASTATQTDANAGHAAGSGTSFGASISIAATAGNAVGAGTAYQPAAAIATSAGGAAGTGAAGGPAPSLATTANHASGTGAAFNATVSTAQQTDAAAGHASGSGSSFGASIAIAASSQNAAGTGQAFDATASVPGAGGGPGKRARRGVARIVIPPTPVTISVEYVAPAPTVAITAEVNDDEVVLELLAGIL